MISINYHQKLPETASLFFILLYGIWAVFVLCLGIGLGLLIWHEKTFWENFWENGGLLVSIMTSFFIGYAFWVLFKLYQLMYNRHQLPKIKQKIAIEPIPPRHLQRTPLNWQSWIMRFHLHQICIFQENLPHKEKLFWITLWIGIMICWIKDNSLILIILLFSSSLMGFINRKDLLLKIHYQPTDDILTITQLNGQNQYDLKNFIGICTIWQPEAISYKIQLIDTQQQAHTLFDDISSLDSLMQTISQHTGLPILQAAELM